MQIKRSGWTIGMVLCLSSLPAVTLAQEATTPAVQQSTQDAFEQSIERRAGETVAEMKLEDATKAEQVKERFKQHFRDIQSWDVAHGKERSATFNALRKDKENAELQAKLDAFNAELQAMQGKFFDEMNAHLTPEQVELIKDRLIGGRYQHNLRGFAAEYPDLPAEVREQVIAMWQQARDEAMPLGTSGAKDQLFSIYKGRVNNFLSQQGYVAASTEKKRAAAATRPAAQ